MIERAEAVAAGTRPLKKDRFVKITDGIKGVGWDLVERARYLAGLKGYLTKSLLRPLVVAVVVEPEIERLQHLGGEDAGVKIGDQPLVPEPQNSISFGPPTTSRSSTKPITAPGGGWRC